MKVICFGDSNTFGYDPRSCLGERYAPDSRWVDIFAARTGWDVHNNGMNGRKIPARETVFSKSTDLLIIMLGTNDLLQGNEVRTITERMDRFLNLLSIEKNRILLIAPPPLRYGEWVTDGSLIEESSALAECFRALAARQCIRFADAGEWDIPLAFDGVHFTEEGNRVFAHALYRYIETQRFDS